MPVQKITPSLLSTTFGGSERYWERRRPAMVSARLLNKVGRSFFGDLQRIEHALATGGADIWEAAPPTASAAIEASRARPRRSPAAAIRARAK